MSAVQVGQSRLVKQAVDTPPHWAAEKIRAWDEVLIDQTVMPFVKSEYWNDNDSMNVFRIVGTKHWDYQGKTWLNMLKTGKRMPLNLGLHETNREYYLDQAHKKPTMSYVTLDGIQYYVAEDGNHRSTIARFDFHHHGRAMLHGVRTTHYQVCHRSKSLFEDVQKWIDADPERKAQYRIDVQRKGTHREDEAGWKQDHYEISFKADNHNLRVYELGLDCDALEALWVQWKTPGKKSFFWSRK